MKAPFVVALLTFSMLTFAKDTGPAGKHGPGTADGAAAHGDAESARRYMHFATNTEGSGKQLELKPSEKVPGHSLRIMSDLKPKDFEAMMNDLPPTKKFVVVKFGAGWCGPCHTFDKKKLPGIVHGVGKKFSDLSEMVLIDDSTEAEGTVSTQNEIFSLPGFALYARGPNGKFEKVHTKEGTDGISTPTEFESYFWDKLPPSVTGAQS